MRKPSPTALIADPDVGRRLAAARRDRGLSQSALAERVGVGRRTVQAWEAGDSGISRASLDAILAALEVAEHDLRDAPAPAPAPAPAEERLDRLERKVDAVLLALAADPEGTAAVRDYVRGIVTDLRSAP